jgi:N-acetyl-gamma-glutamyl-phosphate reductase
MEVASRGFAGRAITEVYPHLAVEETFVEPGQVDASGLDVAFVAYPHMESAGVVRDLLEAGTKLVVDLSADFRLVDVALYNEWYGEHPVPELLKEAHYGLPEVFGAAEGRLVANPGCYPTAAVLALAPVVKRLKVSSVAINALSGTSGAGAKPTPKTHFVSVNENVSPYGLADGSPRHRHTPEIEAVLGRVGEVPEITFVPHLLPISRGELESIYVQLEDPGTFLRWRTCSGGTRRTTSGGRSWRRGRRRPRSRTSRTPTARGSRRRWTGEPGSSCSSRRWTIF